MNKSLNVLMTRKQKNMGKSQKPKTKIDIETISIEKIIEILKKQQEKSIHDISILKQYILTKTKILNKFSKDNLEESSYDLLLSLSLPSSTYKIIKKENSTIINIGDEAEYIYIILKGKVAIYEIEKIHKEMSGYEYFLLLQNYKINNETHLLEKTILENNLIFPIELEDTLILDKIVLKIFLNRQEKKLLPNYLDLLIEKAGMKYSDFHLESYLEKIEKKNKDVIEGMDIENLPLDKKINEYKKLMIYNMQDAWNYAFLCEKKILDELKYIDIDLLKKYIYLTKTKNEELITFFRTIYSRTIEDSDYFGDSEHRAYINKVISLSNNLELFCIKTNVYNDLVRRGKYKLLGNQVNFLLDNFFFRSIYKNYFEKYYFKYFDLIKYKMKQIIVNENDPIQFCYFIKSGTIKLTSNRSILENHILIELIKNIILKSIQYENLNENGNYNIHTALNEIYSEVKNNIEYLNNEINIKKNLHIMTLHEKNCIGSECYYYGLNYLYTAEVNSDEAEIYRLSSDKLMKMLRDKTHRSYHYYQKYCEQSLKIFFDRLVKLNDISLFYIKKNKQRQLGDIYNFENFKLFEEKKNKNDKKLNFIIDKFKLFSSKIIANINNANNVDNNNNFFIEKENNKNNNVINDNNKNIDDKTISNLFLTQTQTPFFRKLSSKNINIKKPESVKAQKIKDRIFNKIANDTTLKNININKNKIYNNLFGQNDKEEKKDLTSYIKIFDYKENLLKQENREEQRAKKALIRLDKAERNEIIKLKKESKTCQNFYKLSLGENRKYAIPFELIKNDIIKNDNMYINKKIVQNDLKNKNNSKHNYIMELYQRNAFIKNRMLMTSLYKNNFSEFFDTKLGVGKFKYDMSKTLLVNKKRFEFSIFDSEYTNKNKKRNKNRSQQHKRRKYTNISEMNKISSIKHFLFKNK